MVSGVPADLPSKADRTELRKRLLGITFLLLCAAMPFFTVFVLLSCTGPSRRWVGYAWAESR